MAAAAIRGGAKDPAGALGSAGAGAGAGGCAEARADADDSAGTGGGPALPVLYSFRRCPYAMRARLALWEAGIRCELREVVLRDKPAALLAASPKGTVPVLALPGGAVLDQSLDIMRWALDRHDPGDWLHRAGPGAGEPLEAMLALVAACDGDFKHHLDRTKYPGRYPGARPPAEHRAAAAGFLDGLEARLRRTAWLAGDAPSLADMAIAPFVRQFAHVDDAWFAAQDWPLLRAWLAGWESSPRLAAVMDKYPAWRPGQAPVVVPAVVPARAPGEPAADASAT
ncbi:MAG: glutathione S-transferase [Xylophilus ampelinus]